MPPLATPLWPLAWRLAAAPPAASMDPVIVPAPMFAAEIVPERFEAVPAACDHSAYGVAVSAWRGVNGIRAAATPLLRTAISSQRASPGKADAPKSSGTVNRPLLTTVGAFVIGPANTAPPIFVGKSVNVRS